MGVDSIQSILTVMKLSTNCLQIWDHGGKYINRQIGVEVFTNDDGIGMQLLKLLAIRIHVCKYHQYKLLPFGMAVGQSVHQLPTGEAICQRIYMMDLKILC